MAKATRRRIALITGCGKEGIGQALTHEFIGQGFEVIATVLPGEDSSHLEISSCHVREADVTDEISVAKLHAWAQNFTDGYLDVLVNNAGIVYQYPAVDYDLKVIEKLFSINAVGPIRMIQAFHRLLVQAQGTVINIGSVGSFFPTPYEAAYGATKAALYQFSNTLRLELAPLGVRVINVCAGEVNTNLLKSDAHRQIADDSVYSPMQERFQQSIHRNNPRMDPRVFARAVVKNAVASRPKNEFWFGTWSALMHFIHRFLPRSTFDLLVRPMYCLDELAGGPPSLLSRLMRKFVRTG